MTNAPDPAVRSRGPRFFVPSEGPWTRRPVDASLFGLGVLLVLAAAGMASAGSALETSLLSLPRQLPGGLVVLFDATYALGAGYAVAVILAVLLTAPRRGRLPWELLVAVGLALGGTVVGSLLAGEGLPDLHPDHEAVLAGETFPTVRVAVVAAVLLVLRPWTVAAYRRVNVAAVGLLCVAAWAIGVAGLPDVLGALGIGLAVAGGTLAALGSPAGHPTLSRVRDNVAGLGLDLVDLTFAARQPWGVRLLHGRTTDGSPVLVKVYGRDATDAHRAARWWRGLLYRDQTRPDATRLQLVEHEALVTILAERAGVTVTPVLAAAAAQGDAVLVLGAPSEPLARRPEGDPALSAALRPTWAAVGRLRAAGLHHGSLTLETCGWAPDGTPVLADFTDGAVAANPAQLAVDVVSLLTAQARRVGVAPAVDALLAELGPEAAIAAVPYLQRAVLPRSLRGEPGVKDTVAAARRAISARTGVDLPPPAPVRRFGWRDTLQAVLLLVAAYALLTMLVQLDWATVVQTWADATWAWVVVGVVVAQLTSPVDALSTMAVVTTRLPLFPLVQLQYAIKLVGLAVSATAGRVALNTSFLKRYGEGPAVAVTATALDSFGAAVANAAVVLLAVLLADRAPDVPLDGPDDLGGLLLAMLAALVVSLVVVALVPRVRSAVVRSVQGLLASFRVVTSSPPRALLLFGTNAASLLITAVAMACMVRGLHPGLSYGPVLAVTAGAALFASVIPVPGNVGVAEAAISAGLVLVGVPSGPAFAIAVTQRIATSYLPPLYGAYALRWLRREDYVG